MLTKPCFRRYHVQSLPIPRHHYYFHHIYLWYPFSIKLGYCSYDLMDLTTLFLFVTDSPCRLFLHLLKGVTRSSLILLCFLGCISGWDKNGFGGTWFNIILVIIQGYIYNLHLGGCSLILQWDHDVHSLQWLQIKSVCAWSVSNVQFLSYFHFLLLNILPMSRFLLWIFRFFTRSVYQQCSTN